MSVGLLMGLAFMLAGVGVQGLCGALPHVGTPDVYEGAPTHRNRLFSHRAQSGGVALIARFGA